VQPTPLAASEIVRFLKADFNSTVISIYEAARLTRQTLGGSSRLPIRSDCVMIAADFRTSGQWVCCYRKNILHATADHVYDTASPSSRAGVG